MRISNLYGKYLADKHASVRPTTTTNDLYLTVERATEPEPWDTPEDIKRNRMQALSSAFERIGQIGVRYHENKNVHPRDRVIMEREYNFLKERILRISSSGEFDKNVSLTDNQTLAKGASVTKPKIDFKLKKVVEAIFSGKIKIENAVVDLTQSALSGIRNFLDDKFAIKIDTPSNFNIENLKPTFTSLNMVSTIESIADIVSNGVFDSASIAETISATSDAILHNATSSLPTHLLNQDEKGVFLLL